VPGQLLTLLNLWLTIRANLSKIWLMRGLILNALRREGHISGEELGRRLNVSRTAVWKYINELRKKGYEIDSSSKLGYFFIKGPDLLLPEEIAIGLNTRVLGREIVYREETGSTQDVAKDLVERGAKEGTVVIAEGQTWGRGRRGRSWSSPHRAGVYLSIILRPSLKPFEVLQIPLIAGVAVCRAIESVTPLKPRIKWPNDIILGGRKVGGILTEMSAEIDRVDHIILGIGVNVNTQRSLIPWEIREAATSLAEECGEYVSRVRFIQHLLAELESLYGEFVMSGFGAIKEKWSAFDDTIGSWLKVSGVGNEVEGEAIDIDRDGALILKQKDGGIEKIVSGDITLSGYGKGR